MSPRLQPRALLHRLLATYWFVPSVFTAGCVALSLALTAIDRSALDTNWLGWAYGGGADGARALLSAVAGSMITVVSVTFSVLVVALTVSSQHFGPRLLGSFMRDRPAQLVLGLFTGTFAYCLMVLRTVQGDGGERYSIFIPHLGITGAVSLALAAVGALIYYVHHVAASMQVSEITARITRELEAAIDRLYPDMLGEEAEAPAPYPPPVPSHAQPVHALTGGYVREVASEELLGAARRHDVTVWLVSRPGDFVVQGQAIAAVHPMPADAERCRRAVADAFSIGAERTSDQDAAFAVQQLVEIALRALSPGTNEPFTAITAIDRLGQALCRLATRRIPSATRRDGEGRIRLVTLPRTFPGMLEAAFEPIAVHAGPNAAVAGRLLQTLKRLAGTVRRPEDRQALLRTTDIVWTSAKRDVKDERHREALAHLRDEVEHTVAQQRATSGPSARAS